MNKDRPFKNMTSSERWAYETHQKYGLLRLSIRGLFIVLGLFVAIPLPVFWGAGQETFITLTYRAIIEGSLADKICKVLVGVLILLVLWQRASYMRRLQHLGKRTEEKEVAIDPGRSSSHQKK